MKTPLFWQTHSWQSILLTPLSYLYAGISALDKKTKQQKIRSLPRPVIVVGNINMGGTGKTPVTITLIKALQNAGLNAGVLSRGYKRKTKQLVIAKHDSSVDELGDEPLLIYQKTSAPMAVFSDRYRAGLALLESHPDLDLFICDDGLQHYQLHRDIEIAVIGKQGLGNQKIFPAGPLRESINRLEHVDFIINNGFDINQLPMLTKTPIINLHSSLGEAYQLTNGTKKPLQAFDSTKVSAIAGIAHPENFFTMLERNGLNIQRFPFSDHFDFKAETFSNIAPPYLMTEKDAMSCKALKLADAWAVPLESELNSEFIATLIQKLNNISILS